MIVHVLTKPFHENPNFSEMGEVSNLRQDKQKVDIDKST